MSKKKLKIPPKLRKEMTGYGNFVKQWFKKHKRGTIHGAARAWKSQIRKRHPLSNNPITPALAESIYKHAREAAIARKQKRINDALIAEDRLRWSIKTATYQGTVFDRKEVMAAIRAGRRDGRAWKTSGNKMKKRKSSRRKKSSFNYRPVRRNKQKMSKMWLWAIYGVGAYFVYKKFVK